MKISYLLFFLLPIFSCQSQQGSYLLDANSFYEKINSTAGAVIIDVRTPNENSEGSIFNSQNINYNSTEFNGRINTLDKNINYFVYCLSGARSSSAAAFMRSNGFKNVYELKGGFLAWNKNNLPLHLPSSNTPVDKISMDEYKKMISSDTLVLIDFYAPWCAPCKKMEPMLNEISAEKKGTPKIIRINIDENKQLAKELQVEEIPILKLFSKGKEIWTHNGFVEKKEILKHISR